MTTHVALLGHPVAESLSPRMQNAAFATARLDWHYSAFDVEEPLAAVAALQTLGFAGANVTIPHKRAVVAACDEADGEAVNTLVFRGGRVIGINTDVEILAGIRATRACVIGAGGAAAALAPALPADTRIFSRRGAWPPDAERLRPDRQRDAGPRRAARRAGRRARRSSSSPTRATAARRRSSAPRARPAATSSTGSRRSSAREHGASSSGRATRRRWR